MSYDHWVEIPTKDINGEVKWIEVGESINYTSNVGKMFYESFDKTGNDWDNYKDYEKERMSCKIAIQQLHKTIKELEDNPKHYKQYNPSNGWGSYEGAIKYLKKLLSLCIEYPEGRIEFYV